MSIILPSHTFQKIHPGTKDGELTAGGQTEETLTHIQLFPPGVNRRRLPTLDKQYTVTLRTTGKPSEFI